MMPRYHLGIFQIRVHARILIKEPYTNQFSCLLGILLIIAEIPRKCQSGDALGSCSKTVSIQLIQFWVRLTVTADVGKPSGLEGSGQ